jgi:hypothetical protein
MQQAKTIIPLMKAINAIVTVEEITTICRSLLCGVEIMLDPV